MNKTKMIRFGILGLAVFAIFVTVFSYKSLRPRALVAQVSCIGMPYGTAGCPLFDEEESGAETDAKTVPPNCGDGILNADEECDAGRFNGMSKCTKSCKVLYCGDGAVSLYAGEECEPETQEVYTIDSVTGQLTVELQYIKKNCGTVCDVPVCNSKGECLGGCVYKFLDKCAGTAKTETVKKTLKTESSESKSPEPDSGVEDQSELPADEPDTHESAPEVKAAVPAVCGNGLVEQGEYCDDGNRNNYDECPNDCQATTCGDGVREGIEECDDGNRIETDDCPTNCKLPYCGNGIREGREECDDGNQNDLDGCPNDCIKPVCGDGEREGKEECDDGNMVDDDGCTNLCKLVRCGDSIVQSGEECDDGNKTDSDACSNECRKAACGDGIIHQGEECDDGNQVNTDSCTNTCTVAQCGDGIVQKGEDCDDGNKNDFDSCPNSCLSAVCGNGIKEGFEECDDGNKNNFDDCPMDCELPVCGDGVREGKEQCDDGNLVDDDSCPSYCRLPVCGNGRIEGQEECDDGNSKNGDGCGAKCAEETKCGNGKVEEGEECDGGENCSDKCKNQTVAATLDPRINQKVAITAVSSLLVAVVMALLALMKKGSRSFVSGLFKKKGKAPQGGVSLDDIPLDELEMPWHKWGN